MKPVKNFAPRLLELRQHLDVLVGVLDRAAVVAWEDLRDFCTPGLATAFKCGWVGVPFTHRRMRNDKWVSSLVATCVVQSTV